MEMLPWDVWGAIPHSDDEIDDRQLVFFDLLTALIRSGRVSRSTGSDAIWVILVLSAL